MHNADLVHIKLLASYNSAHVISPEYVKPNQEVSFVNRYVGGTFQTLIDPADVGIPYTEVPPNPDTESEAEPSPSGRTRPAPGWYAIFAGRLYARQAGFAHFRELEPVERVGYTVFVYRVEEELDKGPVGLVDQEVRRLSCP